MKDLLPSEEVVLVRRRHWLVLVRPLVPAVAAALIALAIAAFVVQGAEPRAVAFLAIVLVFAVYATIAILRWRARQYVLTSQRMLFVDGLVSKLSKSIFLDRVQDITSYQSLWGRLWGYGNLEVEAAGRDAREILDRIPRPAEFRNALFTQVQAYRAGPPHL